MKTYNGYLFPILYAKTQSTLYDYETVYTAIKLYKILNNKIFSLTIIVPPFRISLY